MAASDAKQQRWGEGERDEDVTQVRRLVGWLVGRICGISTMSPLARAFPDLRFMRNESQKVRFAESRRDDKE